MRLLQKEFSDFKLIVNLQPGFFQFILEVFDQTLKSWLDLYDFFCR